MKLAKTTQSDKCLKTNNTHKKMEDGSKIVNKIWDREEIHDSGRYTKTQETEIVNEGRKEEPAWCEGRSVIANFTKWRREDQALMVILNFIISLPAA